MKKNDRNTLAEMRTSFARTRTYQSAERTYSAWIRTGFSVASAGVALGTALSKTRYSTLALIIGTILILLGMGTFIYAWHSFKEAYKYIEKYYETDVINLQSFKLNTIIVTVFSMVLLITSVLGFALMIYTRS